MYADDINLISRTILAVEGASEELVRKAEDVGLSVNINKTKIMTYQNNKTEIIGWLRHIQLVDDNIDITGKFTLLGTETSQDKKEKRETTTRIDTAPISIIWIIIN